MKNSFLMYYKIILFCLVILAFFSSCENVVDSDKVVVSKRQILLNDSPYIIRGICYHPVPKGTNKRSFSNLSHDLALMKEAGINTIRVYEPIAEKSVLDEIYQSGIKVIIGFGYNQGGIHDVLSGTFIDYVNTFKNHNAILMWELGNEYNYHPEWFEGDINIWYKAMDAGAEVIHKNDFAHPVATAHGELPSSEILESCPNIDVWGMNVYRWDNPEEVFAQWKTLSTKPMYLSEAGGDSFMTITKNGYEKGSNEKAQADANGSILDFVFDNQEVCSGVALFSFTDGWWKAGNNNEQNPGGFAPNSTGVPYDGTPNEEYWGIVDLERNKKEAYEVIQKKYTSIINK